MESEPQRFCKLGVCGALLTRKEGETTGNWKLREFCDKRCAGYWKDLQSKRRRLKKRREAAV